MSAEKRSIVYEDQLKDIGLAGSFIYFVTSFIIFVATVHKALKLKRAKKFGFSEPQSILFGPHAKSQSSHFNRKVLIDVNGEVDAVGHANSKENTN